MDYNFDQVIDRRSSDSVKWGYFAQDILPMWVADMDFAAPPPITAALAERVQQGVFGYGLESKALKQALVERMAQLYRWEIRPEEIVLLPGLVCGLNVVTRAIGAPGDGVLTYTPVYGPFLTAPVNQGRTLQSAPLRTVHQGCRIRYELDMAGLAAACTPETRLFMLCNPHNPVGRSFTGAELNEIAAFCAERNLVICSDEIHCDLLLGTTQHLPIASLDPEIAQRTITLMAPSKSFNIPGLGASFAIIQNPTLRRQVEVSMAGIVPHINLFGMVAATTAYTACAEWLAALQHYLTANRDFAVRFIEQELPAIGTTFPESTYLLWLDLHRRATDGKVAEFLLANAKVAVNEGAWFGAGGEGFVRLNFGCPRPTLEEGLQRLRAALA